MTTRKGLGKGTGSGYRNIIPPDPRVHSQSAKGVKQPQTVSFPEIRHIKVQEYAISLKRKSDGSYEPAEIRTVFAQNYMVAAKKLNVSPYAMRTYGIIVKPEWMEHSVTELPIYQIKGKQYFRDARLGEYRNIKDPSDRMRIDDVPNEMLEKPTLPHPSDRMSHSVDSRFKVRLFSDGKWDEIYGDYDDSQIDLINKEMAKPKGKRKYVMGIEFSKIDSVEVKPDKMPHSVIIISDDDLRQYEIETGKINLNDENDKHRLQWFTENYQKGKLTVGVDNDIILWKKLKALSPNFEAHTWYGVKHVILDGKYLLTFDGSRFKGINKINTKTLQFFTNGQIIKGYRKPNKKDLAFFDKVNAEFANPSQMSHSQGGAEYIAMGAGKVLGGAGEVLGGAGQAIGGLGQGAGRAVGGLGEGIGTRIGEGGKQRTIKEEREYLKDVDVLEEHRLERAQKLNALNQIPTPVRSTVMDSSDTIRRMELQAEMEREMARQAQRDKERQEAEAEAQRKKELLLYGRG